MSWMDMSVAQTYEEPDPVQVRCGIPPLSTARAVDRCQQAYALVVAKRVGAQARALRHLCNRQKGFHGMTLKV